MCQEQECYLVEVGYGYNLTTGERMFHRNDYIPYRAIPYFVSQRNAYSAFVSAYRYNLADPNRSSLFGDVYLDFDAEDNFEYAREDAITALAYLNIVFRIQETAVKIYFSGNKGFHIIIPAEILEIQPNTQLNGIYKMFAIAVNSFTRHKTVDTKIYDNKRMFRIPNTIHEKTGLYKIQITPEELRNAPEQTIRTMAKTPRPPIQIVHINSNIRAKEQWEKVIDSYHRYINEQNRDQQGKQVFHEIPPCIQSILDNGANPGERNITIACLAGFYHSYGKSLAETISCIKDWNSRNAVPTNERELERTVRSIYTGGKHYGCSTFTAMDLCDPACRFKKSNHAKRNKRT